MKILTVKNLRQEYTYGAIGVQNLSLECGEGEIISVLSAGEGGKTSLLKCIAGLYPSAGGEIFIGGKPVTNAKIRDRDILFLYEDGGLFNRRSVYYNLSYPMKIRKIDKCEIKDKIIDVAARLNITGFLDQQIFTLTGSEKVKIMVARALLRRAKVYLFDDPFKLAEPLERHKLFLELLPFIKSLEGALIYATTSADEAKTISDEIIIMNYGYVVDSGNKKMLENNPSCLSSYNFLKGYQVNTVTAKILENENDGIYVNIFEKKIFLDKARLLNPVYIGKDVYVSFTARLSGSGFEIKDYFIEYYNNTQFIHFNCNGNDIKLEKCNNETEIKYAVADELSIKIFDAANEKLIYFN